MDWDSDLWGDANSERTCIITSLCLIVSWWSRIPEFMENMQLRNNLVESSLLRETVICCGFLSNAQQFWSAFLATPMKRAPVGTIFHWVRTGAPDTWCNRYNVLLKRCGQLGIPRPSCTTWALRAGSFVAIYTVYIYNHPGVHRICVFSISRLQKRKKVLGIYGSKHGT